jgi:hypothetical protein
MKSKIPCPPAFIPVIKFDHATGLCGGILVVSSRNDPRCASAEKFGIFPSCINRRSSCGSMPSIPSTISFCSPGHFFCRQESSDTSAIHNPIPTRTRFNPLLRPESDNSWISEGCKVDRDSRLQESQCQDAASLPLWPGKRPPYRRPAEGSREPPAHFFDP